MVGRAQLALSLCAGAAALLVVGCGKGSTTGVPFAPGGTGGLNAGPPGGIVGGSTPGGAGGGGAGGSGGATATLRVYVSGHGAKKLEIFALDYASGALTSQGTVSFSGQPDVAALTPDKNVLVVSEDSPSSLTTFSVAPETGALTLIQSTPIDINPVYVHITSSGAFVLVPSYNDGITNVYSLGVNGAVLSNAVESRATSSLPHAIEVDASETHAYIPLKGSDRILRYNFNTASGALTPQPPPFTATSTGDGPRHIRFHPTLSRLYVANELSSSVSVYEHDAASGDLTFAQNISMLPDNFSGTNTAAELRITPNGAFLYASNRGHDSIAMFKVDSTSGALTALGQQATEATPRCFDIDPTGTFLVAAGQDSSKLAVYRINATTGLLEPLATYDTVAGPSWVLIASL